jgi:hypothetical protein
MRRPMISMRSSVGSGGSLLAGAEQLFRLLAHAFQIAPRLLRPPRVARPVHCTVVPLSGSASASMRIMSSSDSPKWCPISCTSTWVTMAVSVSSCSAQ